MKKFILLLLVVCNAYVYAQNKKLDSINNLIAKASIDTQRINLSVEKISVLQDISLDSSIQFGNNIINAARNLQYKKGEAKARIYQAVGYCYKGEYITAKANLDVAKNILSEIKDSIGLAKVFNGYGILYSMQSKYDSSLIFYSQAIAIQQLHTDLRLLSTVYLNMAISYQQQSNYPRALKYYQEALVASEKENDEEGEAYIHLNMAITYNVIDDPARAEQSFNKAVDLAKKLNLKMVEAYAYANLSSLYGDLNQHEKEYDFGMQAAALAKDIGDLGIQASSLSRAATALAKQNKFDEAEKISRLSLIIADSSNQPLNIYQTYASIGLILKMQKKYSQAIPYLEKAFRSFTDGDLYDRQLVDSYLSLSESYEQTGVYGKALTAYKMSVQINDSLRNKDNIRKATELTLNAEFDKKQQVAKAEQQKKDEVERTKQTALIIGFILTFTLALVAFNGFRNKRRSNLLLQKQKEEIQDTLRELKFTQAQLIQSEKMASLGELTAGIAHEIQNPLNFVNNFSDINKELLEELRDEAGKGNIDEVRSIANDVIENSEKINHHGKRADAIVKGMLQHSKASTGNKESADINALCDEYLRLAYHGLCAKDKSFNAVLMEMGITTDFDETIGKINIVPQDIGRVLLNLYNNAFYAVHEKQKAERSKLKAESVLYVPTVTVVTKKLSDKVEIIVTDNGNGIPQNIIDKIFQPFFTTKPTGQGTGLGLSLSYDIIKTHGGEIKVDTKEGEGSAFVIQLPV